MLGLVAFSFGLRGPKEEPNPCNIKLAKAVERIVNWNDEDVVVVSQWEIAGQLEKDGFKFERAVNLLPGGYLGSEEVWEAAKEVFQGYSITTVIPVAQPFLQMTKVIKMIEADGFSASREKIGWIGFDNDPRNNQPWTKGPVRLFFYALKQVISGNQGS